MVRNIENEFKTIGNNNYGVDTKLRIKYNGIMKENVGKIWFLIFMMFIVNGLFSQEEFDEYYIHRYYFPYNRDYINFHIYANVLLKQFYGPPNYDETPEEDKIEYHYVLKLYDPITFIKGIKEVTVEEMQLIFYNEELKRTIDSNWLGYVIEGKVYFSETGHHHTPLIMVVDRINLNG
jgi:hypothetical protein